MGFGQLNDIRHLEIKIEYYTAKAFSSKNLSDEDTVDITLKIIKLKVLKQIMVLLRDIEAVQSGNADMEDLIKYGGFDGLRKNAKMIAELMAVANEEERRIKEGEDSDDVIIHFDAALKAVNERLKKA